jgi:hypothetical protein
MSNINFWNKFKHINLDINYIKYILSTYGTSLRCNRFAIGTCIENHIGSVLNNNNIETKVNSNENRFDLDIKHYGKVSLKYSSSGNIRLHNSMGCNKDIKVNKTLIITPNIIILLDPVLIGSYGLNINDFLTNTSDSLQLKRSIFKALEKVNYIYI